jgi:spore coat polysaccharide biosynthesis protein SpsF
MGSSRLPGKVMRPLAGYPMLAFQLDRLRRARLARQVLVATSTHSRDDVIADLCAGLDVPVFRGDEDDVLARYAQAVQWLSLSPDDVVVRVTADCPLIDPALIDALLVFFQKNSLDYAALQGFPRGLDAEAFTVAALLTAHQQARLPHHREHVTPFLYAPGAPFRRAAYPCPHPELWQQERWTVDTEEDYQLVATVATALLAQDAYFGWPQVLAYLNQHPQLRHLNGHIQQKALPGEANAHSGNDLTPGQTHTS